MTSDADLDGGSLEEVPVINTEDLDGTWREAPRTWGHSLHKLAPYVGGFPPALSQYFIRRFTTEGDTVLDPFSGGGTTALQALLEGRDAIGNDIFSYAYTLSQAKCNAMERGRFEEYLDQLYADANSIPSEELPEPDDDVGIFFHEETLEELLRLREILQDDPSSSATFVQGLVCGILHGPSQGYLSVQTKDTFSGSADYVREYLEENDLTPKKREVRKRIEDKYEAVISDGIPEKCGTVLNQDARNIDIDKGVADFILTSPPYMHVLDYAWNNWLRLWWLGDDRDQERDDIVMTADLSKYRDFMRDSLEQMFYALSPDSRAIIIIGDVKKHRANGTQRVRTAWLIRELAREVGFDVEMVIDDAYGIDKRSYTQFNEIRYETEQKESDEEMIDRCLILTKGDPQTNQKVEPDWTCD